MEEHLEHRLHKIETVLLQFVYLFNERLEHMALDFSKLSAAVDNVSVNINDVIAILNNPGVDNNDQTVIDELTAKLTASDDALQAAEPTPVVVPAPTPAPMTDPVAASASDAPALVATAATAQPTDGSASSASSTPAA